MSSGTFHAVDGSATGTVALFHKPDGTFVITFEDFSIASNAHTNVILVTNRDVTNLRLDLSHPGRRRADGRRVHDPDPVRRGTQWVKNVLAAGGCRLRCVGREIELVGTSRPAWQKVRWRSTALSVVS